MEDLFKAQKACVQLFCKKKKNAPTDPLYKACGLLKFTDIIKMELLKFKYRIQNDLLSKPMHAIMNSRGGKKMHNYQMRNKTIPNVQAHTSVQFINSFMCKGLSTLYTSKESIKEAQSLGTCIKEYKNDTLSKY